MNNFKLKLHDPVVIARRPEVSEEGKIPWGPYQFPGCEYTQEGYIHATFNVGADSVRAYGLVANPHFISKDEGKTWTLAEPEKDFVGGTVLPDGTRLGFTARPSVDPKELNLPETPDGVHTFWNHPAYFYHASHFSEESNAFTLRRLPAGETEWRTELKVVDLPDKLCRACIEGVVPHQVVFEKAISPSGDFWGVFYPWFLDGYNGRPCFQPTFIVSKDSGETFEYRGTIPYEPIPEADPKYDKRDGFSEPFIEFLSNGDIVCLMRTQDGNGQGPSYITFSHDEGRTWEKPQIFDDLGVLPQLCTLGCGVTLSSYGRPGIFIRATDDPTAHVWQDRLTVLEHQYTCAYTRFLPLNDTTALFFYTDFIYPDDDGVKHKTVLCRKVEVVFD